jgi:hypothetical protein
MRRPVSVAHSQAARPRSSYKIVRAMHFPERAVGPAQATSRARCPHVRVVAKALGPAELILAAPANQAIARTIVCQGKAEIARMLVDRVHLEIVRPTLEDLEHRAIDPVISVAPEHRAIVRAISVGQVDPTSDNRGAPISGNLVVPT